MPEPIAQNPKLSENDTLRVARGRMSQVAEDRRVGRCSVKTRPELSASVAP